MLIGNCEEFCTMVSRCANSRKGLKCIGFDEIDDVEQNLESIEATTF